MSIIDDVAVFMNAPPFRRSESLAIRYFARNSITLSLSLSPHLTDTYVFIFQNRHCLLDVCISAIERLKRIQIYPIVLLLRFKSAKQIKEIKDSRYCNDKTSAKAAKEMYEHALKLESDYRQYISGEWMMKSRQPTFVWVKNT